MCCKQQQQHQYQTKKATKCYQCYAVEPWCTKYLAHQLDPIVFNAINPINTDRKPMIPRFFPGKAEFIINWGHLGNFMSFLELVSDVESRQEEKEAQEAALRLQKLNKEADKDARIVKEELASDDEQQAGNAIQTGMKHGEQAESDDEHDEQDDQEEDDYDHEDHEEQIEQQLAMAMRARAEASMANDKAMADDTEDEQVMYKGNDKFSDDEVGGKKGSGGEKGYGEKGYGKKGYRKKGYGKKGYDKKGYDRKGYDKSTAASSTSAMRGAIDDEFASRPWRQQRQ